MKTKGKEIVEKHKRSFILVSSLPIKGDHFLSCAFSSKNSGGAARLLQVDVDLFVMNYENKPHSWERSGWQ